VGRDVHLLVPQRPQDPGGLLPLAQIERPVDRDHHDVQRGEGGVVEIERAVGMDATSAPLSTVRTSGRR
jgi:hypothetical protein